MNVMTVHLPRYFTYLRYIIVGVGPISPQPPTPIHWWGYTMPTSIDDHPPSPPIRDDHGVIVDESCDDLSKERQKDEPLPLSQKITWSNETSQLYSTRFLFLPMSSEALEQHTHTLFSIIWDTPSLRQSSPCSLWTQAAASIKCWTPACRIVGGDDCNNNMSRLKDRRKSCEIRYNCVAIFTMIRYSWEYWLAMQINRSCDIRDPLLVGSLSSKESNEPLAFALVVLILGRGNITGTIHSITWRIHAQYIIASFNRQYN